MSKKKFGHTLQRHTFLYGLHTAHFIRIRQKTHFFFSRICISRICCVDLFYLMHVGQTIKFGMIKRQMQKFLYELRMITVRTHTHADNWCKWRNTIVRELIHSFSIRFVHFFSLSHSRFYVVFAAGNTIAVHIMYYSLNIIFTKSNQPDRRMGGCKN